MKIVEKGEFFPFSTDNRVKGFKLLAKKLRNKKKWDKAQAVQLLLTEEVYSNKSDAKDFLKNVVRASNTEVVSVGKRGIALSGKIGVTVE